MLLRLVDQAVTEDAEGIGTYKYSDQTEKRTRKDQSEKRPKKYQSDKRDEIGKTDRWHSCTQSRTNFKDDGKYSWRDVNIVRPIRKKTTKRHQSEKRDQRDQ